MILTVHHDVADFLVSGNGNIILKVMFKYWIKIDIEEKDTMKIDEFRFFSKKKNADITNEFMR